LWHVHKAVRYNYHIMAKPWHKTNVFLFLAGCVGGGVLLVALTGAGVRAYYKQFQGRVLPGVFINEYPAGGKTKQEIISDWVAKGASFGDTTFALTYESQVATLSGAALRLGYDATLSAEQALVVGRSGNTLSDLYEMFIKRKTLLAPSVTWDREVLDEEIARLAEDIDTPVQDALFQFSSGRVTAFRASHDGRAVDQEETRKRFADTASQVPYFQTKTFPVPLSVDIVKPSITTDQVNSFGVKELIGRGYSEFAHSIPGRIHNVALAASRINGVLIKPGETFSFNRAVGDVSASTGYQTAYIIKDGRTVLGDGGGVCQVSTTLFRAALAAGLPITERRAHAYRVSYYEQAGFKAGIDATVFSPTVDLKFTNDTPGYILIQAKTDTQNLTLTFELYGTQDGRSAEIFNHVVGGISAPPAPLYQDDPTLPPGVVKQVDFAAAGAKASFQYRVTRGGEVINEQTFVSNFRPWQAVFLRGPQI
jgi:vancomycin resistance protein YoaR